MARPRTAIRARVGLTLATALVLAPFGMAVAATVASAAPTDAGSLSGRVVNASGVPLQGICVGASNGPGATTGPDGMYVVDGIEPGEHTVLFVDCNPTPIYVASWYQGHVQQ